MATPPTRCRVRRSPRSPERRPGRLTGDDPEAGRSPRRSTNAAASTTSRRTPRSRVLSGLANAVRDPRRHDNDRGRSPTSADRPMRAGHNPLVGRCGRALPHRLMQTMNVLFSIFVWFGAVAGVLGALACSSSAPCCGAQLDSDRSRPAGVNGPHARTGTHSADRQHRRRGARPRPGRGVTRRRARPPANRRGRAPHGGAARPAPVGRRARGSRHRVRPDPVVTGADGDGSGAR